MVAPKTIGAVRRAKTNGAVRRAKTNGAELGRARILEILNRDCVRGIDGLAKEAHMSKRTLMQRLKELAALVEVREQVYGCALVGLRTVLDDQAASTSSSE